MADTTAHDSKRPRIEDSTAAEEEEEEEEPLPDSEEEDALEDASMAKLIDQLNTVQTELDTINDQQSERVLVVEQEFIGIKAPVYAKRRAIISQIDGFWKKTLLAHPVVSGYINEQDEQIVEYLSEVVVQENEDIRSGFKITFRFKENPFFENAELAKQFTYHDEGLRTHSTPPKWREPFDPREEGAEDSEDEDEGNGNGKRRLSRPCIRFFTWFVAEEAHEPGSHDELADTIRDDIWPNPFKYYMHESAVEVGEEDEDEEDEDMRGSPGEPAEDLGEGEFEAGADSEGGPEDEGEMEEGDAPEAELVAVGGEENEDGAEAPGTPLLKEEGDGGDDEVLE